MVTHKGNLLIKKLARENRVTDPNKLFYLVCNHFEESYSEDAIERALFLCGFDTTASIKEGIAFAISSGELAQKKPPVTIRSLRFISQIIEGLEGAAEKEDLLERVCEEIENVFADDELESSLRGLRIPTTKEINYVINLYFASNRYRYKCRQVAVAV